MAKLKRRLLQIILLIKYIICLVISCFYNKKYKNTWLISERGNEAKDNGYVFYKYLKKYHQELDVKYVIGKSSYDNQKIDKKDIINYQSFKHFMYFINSKYLISTHIMGYSPDHGMFNKLDKKKLVFTKGKRIFLQHGIIYNYLPQLIGCNLDIFVTSSPQERNFIIEKLKFTEKQVVCTGLPRYDNLQKEDKNFILVAPTWRMYLFYSNPKDFVNSEYFQHWFNFLNNPKLHQILKENNLKLLFYPHYEVQKFKECFKIECENITFANIEDYDIAKLLKTCTLYITDYSSTFFDIAYLKTPIIYYQFDFQEFYEKHYSIGYLDLRKDGFGLSVKNEKELIKEIARICTNNFKIDKKYEERIDNFFLYHDQKQCQRIYEAIIKL